MSGQLELASATRFPLGVESSRTSAHHAESLPPERYVLIFRCSRRAREPVCASAQADSVSAASLAELFRAIAADKGQIRPKFAGCWCKRRVSSSIRGWRRCLKASDCQKALLVALSRCPSASVLLCFKSDLLLQGPCSELGHQYCARFGELSVSARYVRGAAISRPSQLRKHKPDTTTTRRGCFAVLLQKEFPSLLRVGRG